MKFKVLSSYYTMFVLLIVLAVGAAIGTFLENDYGNDYAKEVIYASWWYQSVLFLSAANLIFVFIESSRNLLKPGPIFHFAFVIILIGAFVTYHFGLDGSMQIREGEKSNIVTVGDQYFELPFYIALKDFKLKRYPGSRSPSEYSSDVEVEDIKNNSSFSANIYMNNTLKYRGFKFFQTSYDEDEKGTILTVNRDPGVHITYFGYFLLFTGLILTLFDKTSRIRFLMNRIKEMPIASLTLFLIALNVPANTYAQEHEYSDYIQGYLQEHRENSKGLAEEMKTLIVQGPTGRMKPLDTQNKEVLYKLTGKSTWNGMDANQVIIGMFSRPELWKKVNLIKVKTPKLRKLLGVPTTQKLVPFSSFFDDGKFKLTKETEEANKLVPSKRGTFERDLIQVDELLNVAFMSYRAMLLKIFPIPNDSTNTWVDFSTMFMKINRAELENESSKLFDKIYSRDYDGAIQHVNSIKKYQQEYGHEIIPEQSRQDAELWYNNSSIFIKLSIAYLLVGFLLIIYSLVSMFKNNLINSKLKLVVNVLIFSLFAFHTFGIILRWYIGGYAPISNTYETMIYIAYSSVLAGILFLRKSIIGQGAALIMAGVFIFSAYLGEINPQITSLVPVLKSYWLSIHVSVITASYGFLGVSAILGFLTLCLYILKSPKRKHLDTHIQNITYINEATIIFGIILLTIGNFFGAIWANESWGRYWGWDPKETWTYISIIIYTLVLHLRFIRSIYSHYLFAISSVLSFFTILMTYYGVNFYLSGMHSYATGDPVPMPLWAYILFGFIILTMVLGYKKRTI
ncbi:MAG: cytochrome c biogenesis protein CcsA [Flavobacteriaceae bacterium]|nr:cytochrome c biogenesis protein CcsA [Flavobacteriaceae bacterium]